jgi:uncharacterized membrane protein
MSADPMQAKRPVSAVLTGPYGHPFHPILVTIPIGAWASALMFDIASQFVRAPGALAEGAVWLIGLGVVGAVAAASVGFLDLFAIPSGTRAFRTGLVHMSLNLVVTAAYVVNFLWRIDGSRDTAVAAGPLVLSVLSFGTLGISGYLGGKLAFRYGVRVVDEATQADGYEPARPAHLERKG